jgi:hypothetical protein
MSGSRLIVVSEREHSFFDLVEGRPVRIGRAPDNDIVIKDDMASRRHCTVERDASGELRVRDLKSFNGTYLNEKRVRDEPMRLWDAIRIGRTKMFLVERGDAPPVAPARHDESTVDPAASPMPGAQEEKLLSSTRTMDSAASDMLANKEVKKVIEDLIRREREEVERETARRLRDESAPAVLASSEGLAVRARRFGPSDGGGDFFDVFQEADRKDDLSLSIGTVSGVGVVACVAASAARHTLRGVAAGREDVRPIMDLAREVLARTLHPGSAVSLLLARVGRGGRVRIGALGGTGAIQWHAATEKVEVLRQPSRRDEEAPRAVELEALLKDGDRLLLCSDGVGALRRAGDTDPFGLERLTDAFREVAREPAKELVARLAHTFEEYSNSAPDRDATVVVVSLA